MFWPMAKRLKRFWDYILFSRENKFISLFFQGPGRLSEKTDVVFMYGYPCDSQGERENGERQGMMYFPTK